MIGVENYLPKHIYRNLPAYSTGMMQELTSFSNQAHLGASRFVLPSKAFPCLPLTGIMRLSFKVIHP